MSKISLQDKNLLLAEFVGIDDLERNNLILPGVYDKVSKIPRLLFHESLDWLIIIICKLMRYGYSFQWEDIYACFAIKDDDDTNPIAYNYLDGLGTSENYKKLLFETCFETVQNYFDIFKNEKECDNEQENIPEESAMD